MLWNTGMDDKVAFNNSNLRIHVPTNNLLSICKASCENLSQYLLYYAEACNTFEWPIFASLLQGNVAVKNLRW